MSNLFAPKMPKMPEPIKPPTIDDTRQADEELMRLRRRRGRASTFLVSQRPKRGGAWSALTEGAPAATGGSGGGSGSGRVPSPTPPGSGMQVA